MKSLRSAGIVTIFSVIFRMNDIWNLGSNIIGVQTINSTHMTILEYIQFIASFFVMMFLVYKYLELKEDMKILNVINKIRLQKAYPTGSNQSQIDAFLKDVENEKNQVDFQLANVSMPEIGRAKIEKMTMKFYPELEK